MSEQINKVLASTAQAFSTAEQKQARDNIDAQKSITYSYSGSQITAIDGSAIAQSGALTFVTHDGNLTGSGTNASPLGLNTSITLAKNGESATLAYDHLTLTYSDNDPIISASNANIYMSGHAGNASSPYTANYDLQGMHVYGIDTYNNITATATLRYSGGTFVEGTDSAKIKATGMTLHTNADGDQLVDASSVVRWNSYSSLSGFTGCSANNCISGDGTSGYPLGLSATAQWTAGSNWYPMTEISAGHLKISANAFAGAQVYQNESSICNWTPTGISVRHTASGVGGGNIDNFYGEILNLNYNAGQYYLRNISSDASGLRARQNGNPHNVSIFGFGSAAFSDDDETTYEVVDPSSIRRWNSQSASGWAESGNSLSTGFGGNQATAASQYNDGAGNWAARTVKMSGLPDQTLYGFQTRPAGNGSYLINAAGAFVAPDLPTFNLKVYKPTTAPVYLSTSDYPAMPATADGLLILVNLGSGPNVVYPDTRGATSTIGQHNSAQLIWDSNENSWVHWNN